MAIRSQTTPEAKRDMLLILEDRIRQLDEDWSKFLEWSAFIHNKAATEIKMFDRETAFKILGRSIILYTDVIDSLQIHQTNISMIIQEIKNLQVVENLDEAMIRVVNLMERIAKLSRSSTERHEIMENSLRKLEDAGALVYSPWTLSIRQTLGWSRSVHNNFYKDSDDYMRGL
ncbi:hypothetical protein HOLleu_24208 [Holothuria leucospilota]|uniref:Uncharacterized protein n=1 Tax=Holothuria leucospilota TaxID=206669 RepID=A0A9Q1BWG5_HOLLE|nr:hypothetical protein HOLleu_24208 [Holothuria leucospilota]